MRLVFPDVQGLSYRSPSQRIRVLSESWMKDEMYCPACGNNNLLRINSSTNPNLFILHYHDRLVEDLMLIPKHFFTPDILKMRRALSPNARRAGYVGAVIMYSDIPERGKIAVVQSHSELNRDIVMKSYAHSVRLKVENINLRGWVMDVLRCMDKIASEVFSLDDMYSFVQELSAKHPDNHNVTAKIRQQLQFLRDKGFVEFLGVGMYRKIISV